MWYVGEAAVVMITAMAGDYVRHLHGVLIMVSCNACFLNVA